MKKIILLLAIVAVTLSLHAQIKFTVKGKLPANYPAQLAVLQYKDKGKSINDTTHITDGAFAFKGAVTRPQMAMVSLIIPGPLVKGRKYIPNFFLDGNIAITFDTVARAARITGGGIEQKIWSERLAGVEKREKDPANIRRPNEEIEAYFKRLKKQDSIPLEESAAIQIKKYPDSYNSLELVVGYAKVIDPKVFEPLFNLLSKRMQNTDEGKKMKADLALAKRLAVGQPSTNFALNDTSGRPISLASYKGKYVLLDFWASWCMPCRATHPDLIRAYRNYKDKNFEILAVSLDKQKGPWLKAIAEDKITWMQVSDLQGVAGKVPMMYGIKVIPQNFLIDPNGIIVGQNLEGEALDKKLSELLK